MGRARRQCPAHRARGCLQEKHLCRGSGREGDQLPFPETPSFPWRRPAKLQPLGRRQESSPEREASAWRRLCRAVSTHVSAHATRRPRITDHRGLTRSSPVCPPSSPTTPGALSPSRSRSSASSPLGSEGEGQRLFLSLVFPDNRELKIVNIPKSIFRGANSAPLHISHVCV